MLSSVEHKKVLQPRGHYLPYMYTDSDSIYSQSLHEMLRYECLNFDNLISFVILVCSCLLL